MVKTWPDMLHSFRKRMYYSEWSFYFASLIYISLITDKPSSQS
ncbi:hypothetical protein BVRB_8g185910 [Beta vulgaris subsp. vulgaris]|nr:hypothetical protein BVRB_8g185910 [Beta vulgaris subsp. vulgaris]